MSCFNGSLRSSPVLWNRTSAEHSAVKLMRCNNSKACSCNTAQQLIPNQDQVDYRYTAIAQAQMPLQPCTLNSRQALAYHQAERSILKPAFLLPWFRSLSFITRQGGVLDCNRFPSITYSLAQVPVVQSALTPGRPLGFPLKISGSPP